MTRNVTDWDDDAERARARRTLAIVVSVVVVCAALLVGIFVRLVASADEAPCSRDGSVVDIEACP